MKELFQQLKEKVRPKQLFGQNFLIQPAIYEKIVEASKIEKGEFVVEIGGGTGILTKYLTEAGADVVSIEKDRDLIPLLKENVPSAKIIEGDIMKIDIDSLELKPNEYKIVANIPYYLTSKLLRNIFEKWPKPKLIILMVQYELAKRMTAKPPEMNLLALSTQYYSKSQVLTKVSKGNFWPMPDVDSALIKLELKKLDFDQDFSNTLFQIAKKAFSGKRKKLSNTLRDYKETLADSGIDSDRRPETLSVEEWVSLTLNIR